MFHIRQRSGKGAESPGDGGEFWAAATGGGGQAQPRAQRGGWSSGVSGQRDGEAPGAEPGRPSQVLGLPCIFSCKGKAVCGWGAERVWSGCQSHRGSW